MALPYQLVKTLLCAQLESEGILDVTPRRFLNTTLNFKYNMLQDELPVETPKIAYFGIGINGMKNLDDQNLSAPYIPSPANLDMYEPLPFRVVAVDADLTPSERANYRMRIRKTINSNDYWCYYLKKFSIVDSQVRIIETDITTGEETEIDSFDPNNLTPIPNNTTAEGSIVTSTRISIVTDLNLQILGSEVVESCNVIFSGNLLKAKISEISIYSGEDKVITADDGTGGTISYTEAIYSQMMYHMCSLADSYADLSKIMNLKMRISSSKAFVV